MRQQKGLYQHLTCTVKWKQKSYTGVQNPVAPGSLPLTKWMSNSRTSEKIQIAKATDHWCHLEAIQSSPPKVFCQLLLILEQNYLPERLLRKHQLYSLRGREKFKSKDIGCNKFIPIMWKYSTTSLSTAETAQWIVEVHYRTSYLPESGLSLDQRQDLYSLYTHPTVVLLQLTVSQSSIKISSGTVSINYLPLRQL